MLGGSLLRRAFSLTPTSQAALNQDAPFRKLVVGIGSIPTTDDPLHRQKPRAFVDLGAMVVDQLLETSGVAAADIHDPSREHSTSRMRDERGRNRGDRDYWEPGRHGRRPAFMPAKHTIFWDSAPFVHMGGKWCDRLLLGDPAVRAAVLAPFTGIAHSGEAVANALRAHAHIRSGDVLIVAANEHALLGSLSIDMHSATGSRPALSRGLIDAALGSVHAAMRDSGRYGDGEAEGVLTSSPPTGGSAVAVLSIGAQGAPMGVSAAIGHTELSALARDAIPFAAFCAALWCCTDLRTTAQYIRSVQGERAAALDDKRRRQWRQLQGAMMSTRDENVLRAKTTGRVLRGMSSARQTQVTLQVLDRLQHRHRSQ